MAEIVQRLLEEEFGRCLALLTVKGVHEHPSTITTFRTTSVQWIATLQACLAGAPLGMEDEDAHGVIVPGSIESRQLSPTAGEALAVDAQ